MLGTPIVLMIAFVREDMQSVGSRLRNLSTMDALVILASCVMGLGISMSGTSCRTILSATSVKIGTCSSCMRSACVAMCSTVRRQSTLIHHLHAWSCAWEAQACSPYLDRQKYTSPVPQRKHMTSTVHASTACFCFSFLHPPYTLLISASNILRRQFDVLGNCTKYITLALSAVFLGSSNSVAATAGIVMALSGCALYSPAGKSLSSLSRSLSLSLTLSHSRMSGFDIIHELAITTPFFKVKSLED